MPFLSQAQARWMFANKPKMAKEWAGKTPSISGLPQHVGGLAGRTPHLAKAIKLHTRRK